MSNAYLTCPYNELPDRAFFKKLGDRNGDICLEPDPCLSIGPEDKIISAGSCFAARIATFIRSSGLTYLFTDDRISSDDEEVREEAQAIFSLRYGNIYTTRHLVQLLRRVTGKQVINPPVAQDENGRYRNLFRPSVLSYKSESVLRADDEAHLANVRTMLERATVFTFTLGLTEQWIDNQTGITFPSAPGCGFGEFDPSLHTFHNSTLSEVSKELRESLDLLREINSDLSVVLTLSPVPLVATYTSRSAVEATVYSKSLLRQAIAGVLAEIPKPKSIVTYFPSYEIVMNPHCITQNFASDMRSISEVGVERVMNQFRRRFVRGAADEPVISFGLPTQETVVVGDLEEPGDIDPVCEEENIWNAYLNKKEAD